MKKNVLISAFIGSRNLGDEAIFKSIFAKLDPRDYSLTVATVNEPKTARLGIDTVYVKNPIQLLKTIKKSDLLLVGGGGIIQDQTSILNFLYYAFQILYAQKHGVPVILMFVGVGPIKFTLSKSILRRIVRGLAYAIVRDGQSQELLVDCGMESNKIYLAHDPVLNFPINAKLDKKKFLAVEGDYAVVSLRRWFFTNPFLPVFITRNLNRLSLFRRKYQEYMTLLAHDLDKYLQRHSSYRLVLVSLYDGEDDIVARDLRDLMVEKDRLVMAPTSMDEAQYLSVVQAARFVIGMRLHSLILASVVKKPFVALRYSTKVDEFARQMGMKDYSIHVERYDSQALQLSLDKITSSADSLSVKVIETKLKEYQADNEKAFKALSQQIKQQLN